jgi:hypothetical protein
LINKRLPTITVIALLLIAAFPATVMANGTTTPIVTVAVYDPTAAQTTDYGITFTTASSGILYSLEIMFPEGFDVSAAEASSAVNIGQGTLSNPGNSQILRYAVNDPTVIPAQRIIAIQLTNIVNIDATGNYTVTAATTSFFDIIDGPVDSQNFTINPTLTINPEEGPLQTEVEISGAYFGANKQVILTFDGNQIGNLTANAAGGFSAPYTIPTSSPYGHYFTATNNDGFSATAYVYLMPPDIDLNQYSGIANIEVTALGDGFAANSNVEIFWD